MTEPTVSAPKNPAVSPTGVSADPRWRLINRTMRLHNHRPEALIETLHAVQEAFGYLDKENLRIVAAALHVPLSQVFAVATFYHFFSLKPAGEHTCVVCTGTACYIGGAPAILSTINKTFGVETGRTTADGVMSLLTARCLGACGIAPAAVFDKEVAGKLQPQQVIEKLKKWMTDDTDS
ncbi:MAG: bidirectional hydrogenase complex protein HoxE [Pseudomonadota bacterium]